MGDTRHRVEQTIEQQAGSGTDFDQFFRDADWIDQIQLACDLEEEFGIRISDNVLDSCESVDAVAEYIDSLMKAEA
jgi:acyl carrier protein